MIKIPKINYTRTRTFDRKELGNGNTNRSHHTPQKETRCVHEEHDNVMKTYNGS